MTGKRPPRRSRGASYNHGTDSRGRMLLLVLVLVVILGGVWYVKRPQLPVPGPEGPVPSTEQPAQPEWCPGTEIIAAPGTWESAADDDPFHPTSHPTSFMLTVTEPLQAQYPHARIWTLPYPAQFKNVQDLNQLSYDDSRNAGLTRLKQELTEIHSQCPQSKFALMGFSQGAVIVGDLASEIGNGAGPIPADAVAGVALVADGRRVPGQGVVQGTPVPGVGAEVSLAPLGIVVRAAMPGASMRGERKAGFGELNERVLDICAVNDHICDAPTNLGDAAARAGDLLVNNALHAQYATNPNVFGGGMTTTLFLQNWAGNFLAATGK